MAKKWWQNAIIYQIYPLSFADSNSDGLGDLPGLIQHLDYVKDLGVDAIWLSPVFQSPMKDFGYDVSDHCSIDPVFGSMADFEDLVEQCHRRSLRLLIDLVLNHTSDQHSWFQESRKSKDNLKSDYYVWCDPKTDGTPPNNWMSVFGGSAWQWEPRRGQYYLHNFLKSQPDLNFHNLQVQDELLSVVDFWLKKNVDGLRLDVCNFYFHDRSLKDNPPRPENARPTQGAFALSPYNYQLHIYDKDQPETLHFHHRLRKLCDSAGDKF